MATVINTRDVILLAASPRLLWVGAQGIKISATSTTFKVDTAGAPSPSSITIVATLNGISGTISWSTSLGSATVVGSGASVTLPYANLASSVATIVATVVYGGVTYKDSVTISRVIDGATGSTGATGATGSTGATGNAGDAARIAYTLVTGFSLASTPSLVTVSGDNKPATGSWGETSPWQNSPPIAGIGQSVFQTTGTFNSVTNQTTWVVPYLSNLKVGNLSAITVNTGTLTVDTTGHIKGGQTAYNTGNGFWQGYDGGAYKLSIGQNNNRLTYDGSKLLIDVYGGYIDFGATASDTASVILVSRDTATLLPASYIVDSSTSTSEAFYVTNTSSFAGASLVSFSAIKGESLRAVTNDGAQYSGVFQNLGGSTTALAIAGSTYSGFAGSGDGKMNIADGYLPFTGCHIAVVKDNLELKEGDILCDKRVVEHIDINNTITEVILSSKKNDKSCVGIFSSINTDNSILDNSKKTWYNLTKIININSVGEGMINICGENGDLEIGDLITTSNTIGKGMKQDDDIIRNYTVAKVRENVKFDSPDQVKMVACIYLCG